MDKISLALNNSWLWLVIIALVAYLGLAILLYRRTNPPFSKKVRVGLGIIRYLALFLIIICLVEPVLSLAVQKKDNPVVVFLADNSSSIQTVENFDQKNAFLNDFISGKFNNLVPSDAGINAYLFSDTLDADIKPDFSGRQSSIGNVIDDVAENYKGRNLAAIVLASDGLSNYGLDPVNAAREAGVPIYAVDLGPQKISRDIRIVNIDHEPVAYAGKPFDLNIQLEGRGFEKLSIPLVASSNGRELARKNIEILGKGERQKFTLEITPQNPGVQNIKVNLPVQPDEELTDNNVRNINLKVLKSKKRILVATSALNWEATFLQRIIGTSPDFEIDLALESANSRLGAIAFPTVQDSLNQYDAVLLVNCRSQFIVRELNLLDSYVRNQGGSVWFLLGDKSLGRYPRDVSKSILPFSPRYDDRYFNDFDFHINLTEDGKIHPVTRLAEDSRENLALWQSIPPFEDHLVLSGLKPNTKILAVHPERNAGDDQAPLIFYNNYGKGKVLTFAAGPLWKIGFINIGYGGDDYGYKKLVMNSINWLTTEEDVERIRLAPNQAIYKSGERVGLSATVLDDNYSPLENSVVNVIVKAKDNPDSLIVSMNQEAPGRFTADLGMLPAGDYTINGSIMWEDRLLKQITSEFKVEGFSLEEETLFLPPDMMKKISQASGGKYYSIGDFEDIAGDLNTMPRYREESYETRIAGNFWVLLIILGLLTIEWIIRKRLQLL